MVCCTTLWWDGAGKGRGWKTAAIIYCWQQQRVRGRTAQLSDISSGATCVADLDSRALALTKEASGNSRECGTVLTEVPNIKESVKSIQLIDSINRASWMRQGVLGLLLAHHRPETAPCLSSITSSKFFFYLVFISESGSSSIFSELFHFFFIFLLFTLQKSKFLLIQVYL